MTKLGTGGRVTVYNNGGDTDVVVDIGGTYTDATVAGTLGVVQVGADGKVGLFSSAQAHVVFDVAGWFT